jgi:hypothetical protein
MDLCIKLKIELQREALQLYFQIKKSKLEFALFYLEIEETPKCDR